MPSSREDRQYCVACGEIAVDSLLCVNCKDTHDDILAEYGVQANEDEYDAQGYGPLHKEESCEEHPGIMSVNGICGINKNQKCICCHNCLPF